MIPTLTFAVTNQTTNQTILDTYNRLQHAQSLSLTLSSTDAVAASSIYQSICTSTNRDVPTELRSIACDLQYNVPHTPSAPTVISSVASALLSSQIESEIDILRTLDQEWVALKIQQTLETDSAKVWLELDGSIADSSSYTAVEIQETFELRTAYSKLIHGLNNNITSALSEISVALKSATKDLEHRKSVLEADAKKEMTINAVGEMAHSLLFAVNIASGVAMSGWSSESDLGKMTSVEAAAKQAKDNVGKFKTLLAMVQGAKAQKDAAAGDASVVTSIESLVASIGTQINVLDAVALLMGSMRTIVEHEPELNTSQLPELMLETLNQTISAVAVQAAANSLIGALTSPVSSGAVQTRSNVDSFVGLVQARFNAVEGWWSANSKLRVLLANKRMLDSQHTYLANQINDTTVSATRASKSAELLLAHRRARVSAVLSTLRRLLWVINYETGGNKAMESFAEMGQVLVELGNSGTINSGSTSDTNIGALPLPSTAALAARHAKYLAWFAQGFNHRSNAVTSTKSSGADMVSGAAPFTPTNSSTASMYRLKCWHVRVLTAKDIDMMALARGEEVGFSIMIPQSGAKTLAKVTNVRSYTLPFITDDGSGSNTTSPCYVTVSHLGESLITTTTAGGKHQLERFAHARVTYPFGYHQKTLCPLSDTTSSDESTDGGSTSLVVNPSLYGAWTVRIDSIKENTTQKTLTGIRVEFQTSSWNLGSIDADNEHHLCSIPIQLQRVIQYNVNQPRDPYLVPAVVLTGVFVVAALVLFFLAAVYKKHRVEHGRWRAQTDIREIEIELKTQEQKLLQEAGSRRRASVRADLARASPGRVKAVDRVAAKERGVEEVPKAEAAEGAERRVSNPARTFDRRKTNPLELKKTGGSGSASTTNITTIATTVLVGLCMSGSTAAPTSYQCEPVCASPVSGNGSEFAQNAALMALSTSARSFLLQGNNNEAASVYKCCSLFIEQCLLPVTTSAEKTNRLLQSFVTASHNVGSTQYLYNPTSQPTRHQQQSSPTSSFLSSSLDFDTLATLTRLKLSSVKDLDTQLIALNNLQLIDQQIYSKEILRQLQIATANAIKDQNDEQNAEAISTVLVQEMSLLISKYSNYMSDLSSSVKGALTAESSKISQLDGAISSAKASKRKKSFWHGLMASLEIVAGGVLTAVGMPEAGIPLLIAGANEAVTAATTALGPPPVGVDLDKELRQVALDTIENIKQLSKQAVLISSIVHEVGSGSFASSTLAKELPSLYLLTVKSTSFTDYMNAFATNLAATTTTSTAASVEMTVQELSSTVHMIVNTLQSYFPAHMDVQHAELNYHLHTLRMNQLKILLQDSNSVVHARTHIIQVVQARRDQYAIEALRSIAMQKSRFFKYALIGPSAAINQKMPSVWTSPSSSTLLHDTSNAPLNTKTLLAAAVSNYIFILKSQAAAPSQQTPQSCLVSYAINMSSHPQSFAHMKKTGDLSLVFSPLTTSGGSGDGGGDGGGGDGGGGATNGAAPKLIQPGQRFVFDASVTSIHVFVDLVPSKNETTAADGSTTIAGRESVDTTIGKYFDVAVSFSNEITRVRILKSGTDVRLDADSTPQRYSTKQKQFEYVYASESECPISSSQNELASDRSTSLSSSGTAPSLYGAWTITPMLTKEELSRVVNVRMLMNVEHKIGVGKALGGASKLTSSSSAPTTSDATQILAGGARGDAVDGICGAVPDLCQFAITQGDSAESCNAGVSVLENKTKSIQINSIWLAVVIGMSVALVPTILLAFWTAWKIVTHERDAKEKRGYFNRRSSVGVSLSEGMAQKDSLA